MGGGGWGWGMGGMGGWVGWGSAGLGHYNIFVVILLSYFVSSFSLFSL